MEEEILVFDVCGDYAHFRKIETITSPLTYSIPTGTALTGMLAAMMGFKRDSYYNFLSPTNLKFAIKLLHPIKKIRMNLNLINTKKGFLLWDIPAGEPPRTLIPFEFLKNPAYRIYVSFKNKEHYNTFKNFLENHKSFYTPYLGISELIANFEYVGEFIGEWKNGPKEILIHSVVPLKEGYKIIPEEGKVYVRERMPLFMNDKRVVQKFIDVLFEMNGKPIKVKLEKFIRVKNDNLLFLQA
jgi:CRISPR-associated protein Cas5h